MLPVDREQDRRPVLAAQLPGRDDVGDKDLGVAGLAKITFVKVTSDRPYARQVGARRRKHRERTQDFLVDEIPDRCWINQRPIVLAQSLRPGRRGQADDRNRLQLRIINPFKNLPELKMALIKIRSNWGISRRARVCSEQI